MLSKIRKSQRVLRRSKEIQKFFSNNESFNYEKDLLSLSNKYKSLIYSNQTELDNIYDKYSNINEDNLYSQTVDIKRNIKAILIKYENKFKGKTKEEFKLLLNSLKTEDFDYLKHLLETFIKLEKEFNAYESFSHSFFYFLELNNKLNTEKINNANPYQVQISLKNFATNLSYAKIFEITKNNELLSIKSLCILLESVYCLFKNNSELKKPDLAKHYFNNGINKLNLRVISKLNDFLKNDITQKININVCYLIYYLIWNCNYFKNFFDFKEFKLSLYENIMIPYLNRVNNMIDKLKIEVYTSETEQKLLIILQTLTKFQKIYKSENYEILNLCFTNVCSMLANQKIEYQNIKTVFKEIIRYPYIYENKENVQKIIINSFSFEYFIGEYFEIIIILEKYDLVYQFYDNIIITKVFPGELSTDSVEILAEKFLLKNPLIVLTSINKCYNIMHEKNNKLQEIQNFNNLNYLFKCILTNIKKKDMNIDMALVLIDQTINHFRSFIQDYNYTNFLLNNIKKLSLLKNISTHPDYYQKIASLLKYIMYHYQEQPFYNQNSYLHYYFMPKLTLGNSVVECSNLMTELAFNLIESLLDKKKYLSVSKLISESFYYLIPENNIKFYNIHQTKINNILNNIFTQINQNLQSNEHNPLEYVELYKSYLKLCLKFNSLESIPSDTALLNPLQILLNNLNEKLINNISFNDFIEILVIFIENNNKNLINTTLNNTFISKFEEFVHTYYEEIINYEKKNDNLERLKFPVFFNTNLKNFELTPIILNEIYTFSDLSLKKKYISLLELVLKKSFGKQFRLIVNALYNMSLSSELLVDIVKENSSSIFTSQISKKQITLYSCSKDSLINDQKTLLSYIYQNTEGIIDKFKENYLELIYCNFKYLTKDEIYSYLSILPKQYDGKLMRLYFQIQSEIKNKEFSLDQFLEIPIFCFSKKIILNYIDLIKTNIFKPDLDNDTFNKYCTYFLNNKLFDPEITSYIFKNINFINQENIEKLIFYYPKTEKFIDSYFDIVYHNFNKISTEAKYYASFNYLVELKSEESFLNQSNIEKISQYETFFKNALIENPTFKNLLIKNIKIDQGSHFMTYESFSNKFLSFNSDNYFYQKNPPRKLLRFNLNFLNDYISNLNKKSWKTYSNFEQLTLPKSYKEIICLQFMNKFYKEELLTRGLIDEQLIKSNSIIFYDFLIFYSVYMSHYLAENIENLDPNNLSNKLVKKIIMLSIRDFYNIKNNFKIYQLLIEGISFMAINEYDSCMIDLSKISNTETNNNISNIIHSSKILTSPYFRALKYLDKNVKNCEFVYVSNMFIDNQMLN